MWIPSRKYTAAHSGVTQGFEGTHSAGTNLSSCTQSGETDRICAAALLHEVLPSRRAVIAEQRPQRPWTVLTGLGKHEMLGVP